MKKIFLLILCLFFNTISYSQNKLNLIDFITFNSEFEKQVFFENESTDVLKLFLAISQNGSEDLIKQIQGEINSLITDLERLNIGDKKPKKKIKILFDYTHSKMLRKYEEDVDFEDIFNKSTYNCVTASALYSILLEYFEIPYHIIEEPTHVYVLTYPNSHNMILETTLPNTGFYAPSNSDIEKTVKTLVENKYVTESEVQAKGTEKVYHDFFYSNEPITLRRLASLQYYNKSVGFLDNDLTNIEIIDNALNPILKAQYLEPSDKNNLILYSLLGSKLNQLKLDSLDDFKQVALFYGHEKNVNNGSPISYFVRSIQTELSQNGRSEFITEVYNYLREHVRDTVDLDREYFLGMSKYYLLSSEFDKSLHFGSLGYDKNPKDVTFHSFVKQSIFNLMAENGFTDNFENEMNAYEEKFGSFLKSNKIFQGAKIDYKISLLSQKLQANRYNEGLPILNEIEKGIDEIQVKPVYNKKLLGLIYAEYCAYYYRKGEITKSKLYLDRGLKHDKNNAALIRKQDILK